MQVYFLEADVPLTKTFTLTDTGLEKSSYPLVGRFTSYEATVDTLDQFHDALVAHAANNHCLLKGQLRTPLNNESRAGATDSLAETQWIVFDFDNVEGLTLAEDAIRLLLPPPFRDASYVLQHSASAGIAGEAGLRAHVFFLLTEPTLPDNIKLWVRELNLTNPLLARNLTLSANGHTLKFALDVTCNQNDKLIYIAPPQLNGDIVDPYAGQRIQLVRKAHERVDFNQFPLPAVHALQSQVDAIVSRMREDVGLPAQKARYKFIDGEQVLANPTVGRVTGEKIDRNWVRLNLAGEGPTWGYYYDAQNPKLLYSFKGHPAVLLKDFLPDYFAQIQARRLQNQHLENRDNPIRPFAFRHLESDTYYNGVYDSNTQRIIKIARTTGGKKLKDFFGQYGMQPPGVVQDWTYEFRPWDDRQIDFDDRFCNTWQPSDIMLNAIDTQTMPPLTEKVLRHVTAYDERSFKHFLNWLACVYQFRKKILTAWVFQGVQGTGKGVLFEHVLMPIFGPKYCVSKTLKQMDDNFNADFETALIYNVDEVHMAGPRADERLDQVKNMVTANFGNIRVMRQDPRQAPNYTNFIFTGNHIDMMRIEASDRRFSVAPRQEEKLAFTMDDVPTIRAEAAAFAGFLKAYPADITVAQQALENDAKTTMKVAAMEAVEQMVNAVATGDLAHFVEFMEDGIAPNADPLHWQNFQATIKRWISMGSTPTVICRNDLMAVYAYLVGDSKSARSPHKFSKMLEHKNVHLTQKHYSAFHAGSRRGIPTTWRVTEEQIAGWIKNPILGIELPSNVTVFPGAHKAA